MKKTYLIPTAFVVRIQHQGLLMESVTKASTNADVGYGGASTNNTGGEVRTKESVNVWDEDW